MRRSGRRINVKNSAQIVQAFFQALRKVDSVSRADEIDELFKALKHTILVFLMVQNLKASSLDEFERVIEALGRNDAKEDRADSSVTRLFGSLYGDGEGIGREFLNDVFNFVLKSPVLHRSTSRIRRRSLGVRSSGDFRLKTQSSSTYDACPFAYQAPNLSDPGGKSFPCP